MKEMGGSLIFYMLINIEIFCKLILSYSMGLARHAENTQKSLKYPGDIENILTFGIWIAMGTIFFICQSKTITSN